MDLSKPQPQTLVEVEAGETILAAYQAYEERERSRDYSLTAIGQVVTLLERDRGRPVSGPRKVERVWHGPLSFATSPDPTRPYLVLMLVRDLAGKVTLENPADLGGGLTDWWLYREAARVWMDAVGGGAGSLRGASITWSLYDPELVHFRTRMLRKPRHPVQVLITGSGRVDPEREFILAVPEFETVVLTSAPGAELLAPALSGRQGKHVVTIGTKPTALDLSAGLRALRHDFGVERLLVVGGAETASALLEQRLVDELFLTQSAHLLGGSNRKTFFEGTGFPALAATRGKLCTAKVGVRDAQTLFLRYRLT